MSSPTNLSRKRGRLKIYLGMAAGVGKTYSMLADGWADLERGQDIVVGYVEPHGRKETDDLAIGIPAIPPREIDHRGIKIKEFDLEGALSRRPRVLLVDELAHTNAEGSRHGKRWQDVAELLEAGIDVRTTVNIQHIESLRDVVAKTTGIFVQETVPDAFFEGADEVELVDIPPEELHQRLREGKVYVPEKIEQALAGFFKRENLMSLRELALRHTAERVDEEMRRFRALKEPEKPWQSKERILVCVAPNRMAPRVVRSAKRLATNLHASLHAVSVSSVRQSEATERNREQLQYAMNLAESLGATTSTLAAEDIVAELIRFAQAENITTIVVGKPIRARWRELIFGSVVDSLIRASGDIDVLVITGAEEQGTPLITRPHADAISWSGYAATLVIVALCTGIGFLMIDRFDQTNIVMIYLLGVAITSVRFGRGESVFAAILGVLAFDVCFVHPRGTLAVSDAQYIVTFAIMLTVSLLVSTLTLRLKQQSHAATARERNTSALYELSRRLAAVRVPAEMAAIAAEKASSVVGAPVGVLIDAEPTPILLAPSSSGFEKGAAELGAAAWAIGHGKAAGKSTATLAGISGLFLPLTGTARTLGVLAVDMRERRELDTSQRHLLEAIANQLAGSLERADLARESHESALRMETEQLRSDLLSAVSHDLRTPLASIEGGASILAARPELEPQSRELAVTIQEKARSMEQMIGKLLDMTRIQGSVELNLDWYGAEELIANAVERTEPLFAHPIEVHAESAPLLRVDGVLMEQVLVNLLENAARHAGPQTHVRIAASERGIVVEDDGPGLPPGHEESIFERFERHGEGGFGLGLAICKAVVEAHGGKIGASNVEPHGARFEITIPMEPNPHE